ncbi:hypothetical protein TNCV_55561 [Trichonephila clavipes]|nr:hypothetical protein TNCV_55561 [Trichonephila clavipes]
MWRRSNDPKLVNENFHKFLASIARVYPPTDHDEMQACTGVPGLFEKTLKGGKGYHKYSDLHATYGRKRHGKVVSQVQEQNRNKTVISSEIFIGQRCYMWLWGRCVKMPQKMFKVSTIASDAHRSISDYIGLKDIHVRYGSLPTPCSAAIFAGKCERKMVKLENYLLATEKDDRTGKIKIAILLNLLGSEGFETYNTFKLESKVNFSEVLQ